MKLLDLDMVYGGFYMRIPRERRIQVIEAEQIFGKTIGTNLWRLDDLGDFMEDEIWKESGK